MKPPALIDIEIFPPFDGFPKEGLSFLKRLKRNNRRPWFEKHKSEYEEFVKLPMQSFIAALKSPMMKLAPEFQVDPKKSMFRIYRDTRFSRNKNPYKTHIAAIFHVHGHWQESAGFYAHIEPGSVYVGGGIYMPGSDQLKLIRRAIAESAEEFIDIIEDRRFTRRFGSLEGEKLQRMPLGYPAHHPMGDWLKFKSFYAGAEWGEKECLSRSFVEHVLGAYSDILPLVRFLNKALGRGK
ncbi:MAG TPA: DUF2461 domain-containing protein [Bacteroidota bacterium]|nr:DUF2461 domain-containing protein [Bacteroidota bacterium]